MASTLPKWSGRKDAQAKLELTPFRAKDALSSHHLEEVHNIADQEYGGQPARTPKQWWEFLQHQGGWLLATAHIVTAIIGAGVLGLPYALSWLGGCCVLCSSCSVHTPLLLQCVAFWERQCSNSSK
eukprot:GHRR01030242.1.p1 GENE.GHRR01030242.1~~GHRR01030242.1.p1  ORF type:complete len:126 (+),score=30.27 GHRR01030242.1:338-715(+)